MARSSLRLFKPAMSFPISWDPSIFRVYCDRRLHFFSRGLLLINNLARIAEKPPRDGRDEFVCLQYNTNLRTYLARSGLVCTCLACVQLQLRASPQVLSGLQLAMCIARQRTGLADGFAAEEAKDSAGISC